MRAGGEKRDAVLAEGSRFCFNKTKATNLTIIVFRILMQKLAQGECWRRGLRLLVVCCVMAARAWGRPVTNPTELVRYGEELLRGRSSQIAMTMHIQRPSFRRNLSLRSWTMGTKRALVEILEPVKEKGIVSLRRDASMWNYLPKTESTIRVPLSLMLQSWMGSDFNNDDLMKLSSLSSDYTHAFKGSAQIDGEAVWVIECRPKPKAPVVWGKIIYSARQGDWVPWQEVFYDENNQKVRELHLRRVRREDDRILPTELTIVQSNAGYSTTILYTKLLFNRQIPENIFSQEQLRHTSIKAKNETWGWFLDLGPKTALAE